VQETRSLRAIQQQVRVVTCTRSEACMEFLADWCGPQHGHAGRQQRVDAAHPRGERTLDRGIEMHDLVRGVHTRVGATGGVYAQWLARDRCKRALQRILHRAT
jgi:hypothetical protein